MPNYQNGKIYKIVGNGMTYYGSTTIPLYKRFYDHKHQQTCSSKDIVCHEDCEIILVENYPCETRQELLKRERFYIDNFKCINKLRPYISKEEKKEKQQAYDTYRNKTEKRRQMFRDRELKPERIAYRQAYEEKRRIINSFIRELKYYNL